MHDMFLIGLGVNQNVVDVDDYPLVQHISEDIVNKCLEHGRTVGEPERHNEIFIVPRSGGKGSFSLVSLTNADEVVGTTKVQFSEISSSSELFEGCRDEW